MTRWTRPRFLFAPALLVVASSACPGCARGPETLYGSVQGTSLNGTGAFAGLLRQQGHTIRPAWSLTEPLADWAVVLVRFATRPGPIDSDEADWYANWLDGHPERSLIYVVRDYDAEPEYWARAAQRLTAPEDAERRSEAELRRDRARGWTARLPARTDEPADPADWFATGLPVEPPVSCKSLGGPWADGVDPAQAALPLHEAIKAEGGERVLLTGDGQALAVDWTVAEGGRVLVVASGAFLLNLPLVNPARRTLAERVAAWAGKPGRVAFVTGPTVLGNLDEDRSLIDLAREDEHVLWVAVQFVLFGLVASLARAPRLGRPRPDPPSDADRPAAHAEALGALLERSRGAEAARQILAAYRRWRFPRQPQD